GTFGVVLAARYFGRDVAVKKARAACTSRTLEDFRQEAELHFAMRHENIVEVIAFSVGDAVHPPCLVMERMDESLYELLSLQLSINFPWALGIIHDVCKVRL
ncbi:unnamed protein product, partial [Ectocarpus sp. 12 AP-2014]